MATLLFFSLLCSFSFGRPQSLEPLPRAGTAAIRWKIGDLSLQSHGPSSLSARFLLFQQQPPPPLSHCGNGPILVLLSSLSCLREMAKYKPNNDLIENGLVCEGGLKDQGNLTGWHTCNEYMEPRGKRVPDEKKQWLWWRIYDVNIGDFAAGSIPIYNTASTVQSNVRRGLYSAKLEIVKGEMKYTNGSPKSLPSNLTVTMLSDTYNITSSLDCQEDALGRSNSDYTCKLKNTPASDCGGSSQSVCNRVSGITLWVIPVPVDLAQWKDRVSFDV